MPFYPFNEELPLGETLREGLDDLRGGRYKLAHVLGNLQQMTAAQAVTQFGFADEATATSAKAELESDIQKLLSDDTGVNSAVVQMLNQFG
jgi:hypothetical protein